MRNMLLVLVTAGALVAGGGLAGAQQDPGAYPTNLNAGITLEQKQRIREVVFKDGNAPRVKRVEFSLTIGNVVPGGVALAPVPDPVVQTFPEWRGFAYFVVQDQVQDQIIIVDPRNHTIVAIIA
jgi:hypothetical protein